MKETRPCPSTFEINGQTLRCLNTTWKHDRHRWHARVPNGGQMIVRWRGAPGRVWERVFRRNICGTCGEVGHNRRGHDAWARRNKQREAA